MSSEHILDKKNDPPRVPSEKPIRVALRGISKRFGGVRAIKHADLVVHAGTVHALVGENGAGKSTLIKVLGGVEVPDTGNIEYDGNPQSFKSTHDALALGIATVYQEVQLFQELTVAENIFAGRELRKGLRVDWQRQRQEVDALLELIGLPAHFATAVVNTLSVANQQQVSIAKALAQQATTLILDEPSAILSDNEIEVLFGIVRRLRDKGVAIIYISHRLDELLRIADEVTVMRDGKTIGTYDMAAMTVRAIAEKMVGGIPTTQVRRSEVNADTEPALKTSNLEMRGRFHDVDLRVQPGEIVALYGLIGSGAAEIAGVIFGMSKATSGTLRIQGKEVFPRSPRHAQRLGIALLPANRKTQGMFVFQPISFNISIGRIPLFTRLGVWFDRKRERSVSRTMIEKLAVVTPDERQPIGAMSGGNAQKVVLARQLVERPPILILEEPTQGVDIGAKEEIHTLISELADEGTAVLVVTTDLPEALRIADRIVVVRAGTTTVEFDPTASQVDVLAAAAGDATEEA